MMYAVCAPGLDKDSGACKRPANREVVRFNAGPLWEVYAL